MNAKALRGIPHMGYPHKGSRQTGPQTCMPLVHVETLQGLCHLTLSIILDMYKMLAWELAVLPFTPLLMFPRIPQRRLCLTMLLPYNGIAEMRWIPIA